MFLRICSLALLIGSISSTLKAATTVEQATTCFETMLEEAQSGASFSAMVESYIAFTVVAARAVHYQKGLVWNDLNKSERTIFTDAIHTYFDKEADKVERGVGERDYVNLATVELRSRSHKKVKSGFQLSGVYHTLGGGAENFAIYVVKNEGRCYIYDVRWRDAWLSKYVPLP